MSSTSSWASLAVGLFLFSFSVVALSGPGRIDIDDGQTRFAVAESLREHGDSIVRDPDVSFFVFPGRHGDRYTMYRFPQSLAGAAAIWLADVTGRPNESRRHFFFTLVSAAASAIVAVIYLAWFSRLGLRPQVAWLWASAGVFCTPTWFYGTTTYDDILGAAATVGAIALAFVTRRRRALWGAAGSGFLLGLAFNCKQPLACFLLPALAASYDDTRPLRSQLGRYTLIVSGICAGMAAYWLYDHHKFPADVRKVRDALLLAGYVPNFPGNPVAGFLSLAISPNAGAIWYCPTLLLSFRGFACWRKRERWFCFAVFCAVAAFVAFVSSLRTFKGEWSWGPRYLTPVFALLWIFAPAGAFRLSRRAVTVILGLGLLVQLAGLSVDPFRLYIERGFSAAFYFDQPWINFDARISHLLNRPREIAEILMVRGEGVQDFSPARSPTFFFKVSDFEPKGRPAIARYSVLSSFRPWWISQRRLPPSLRPVALSSAVSFLLGSALAGLILSVVGWRTLETPSRRMP